MSARKNQGAIEDAVDAVDTLDAVESVEPVLDPELDQVPTDELDELEDVDGAAGHDDTDGSSDGDTKRGFGPRSRIKIVLGAAVALVVAAVAVGVAGAMGGSDETGIPEMVGSPAVVIEALEASGISCAGSAVADQVGTCSATIAVRVFDTPADAEAYVKKMLKSPLTSSANGWVGHGNVIVSGPLLASPEIAEALGEASQIY